MTLTVSEELTKFPASLMAYTAGQTAIGSCEF